MDELRNIGIVAHIDAGKTTLTEQILSLTGLVGHPGSVEDGTTLTDWKRQERERGITIGSAAITCRWRGAEVTIVDTPGHVDFTLEVERTLTVLDGVVLVLSGPDGVQAQTQTVWHQAARRRLPVLGFVNKLDRPGFDDEALQLEIRERIGLEPLPLQVPLVAGGERIVLLDLLSGERLSWEGAQSRSGDRPPVVSAALDEEEELQLLVGRDRIIDLVAEHDDAFAEAILAGEHPEPAIWMRAIRHAVHARACIPLCYGVARSGIGPRALLDGVLELLPSPAAAAPPTVYDLTERQAQRPLRATDRETPTAFVFKTERRADHRRVAWIRVFAGEIATGEVLSLARGGGEVLVQGLLRLLGGDGDGTERLGTGMIGALVAGPDQALPPMGETLVLGEPTVSFEPVRVPAPVIAIALEADDLEADSRMRLALDEMVTDDPSLAIIADPDTGQTLLAGMGELHLELALEELTRDRGIPCRGGTPRARTRHIIESEATGRGHYAITSVPGGAAAIAVRLTPLDAPGVPAVAWATDRPADPHWLQALESGITHALLDEGDVVEAQVTVTEIRHSGGGLTARAFWEAGAAAIREALAAAGRRQAEPWMTVTIVVPDVAVGRITGDLARRRGRVRGSESRGGLQILDAQAPLSEMIDYATSIRSLTGGRGTFSMEPAGYRAI